MRPAIRAFARVDAEDVPAAAVAVVLAAVFVVLAAKDGGFAETDWLPAALLVLGILALGAWQLPFRLTRAGAVALAAFGVFTAWSAVSIAWGGVRGDAWLGADRTLLYLALFAVVLLVPWRASTATAFVSLFAVGVTVVAAWQFLRVAAHPVELASFFVAGRLATPISYPNADCALLLIAALPALVVSALRATPLLLRGVLLAAAGVSAELAIASQSRASLLALPLVLLVTLALSGGRVRLVCWSIPLVATVAVSAPRLLDLYDATLAGPGTHALRAARTAVLLSAAVLLVAGWALAAIDARVIPSARVVRRTGLVLTVLAAVAVLIGAVGVTSVVPHPVASVRHQWTEFVKGGGYSPQETSHFVSSGTNRYDIWRVAIHEFRRHPVGGVGVDNFAVDYLRERRSPAENPAFPHSVLLRVLSQTGLVGALAFLVFLSGAAFAVAPAAGGRDTASQLAVAAAAPVLYFLAHGSVDWLWEIPAIGGAAVVFLGLAVTLAYQGRAPARTRRLPRPLVAAGASVLVAALALPWLSAHETASAGRGWVGDRASAYAELRLARRLDPLSDVPDQTEGVIAARAGDPARAARAFRRALARTETNWYSHLELSVATAALGDRVTARRELERALALNPREPLLALARRRLAAGHPLDQSALDRTIAERDTAIRRAR